MAGAPGRVLRWAMDEPPPPVQGTPGAIVLPVPAALTPEPVRSEMELLVEAEGTSRPSRRFAEAMSSRTQRSRLIQAFNAAQPVDDRYELLGRMGELNKLVDGVVERHQHALIFGARGSGKTSLARIFGDLADEADCLAIYHAATGDTGFSELLRPYLDFLPGAGRAGSGAAAAEAVRLLMERDFGARDLVSALAPLVSRRVFLIVDEFDRIEQAETKARMASLLKLLSDTRSPVQFLLVGIAADVNELLEAHPSLRRHIVAVQVRPFSARAVDAIIEEGSRRSGMAFPSEPRRLIAAAAAGSPYHVRLFCQGAGIAALEAGLDTVDAASTAAGLRAAFDDWSMVNPETATLFERLCRRPELREPLLAIAREAALGQTVEVAGGRVSDALAPALAATGTPGLSVFADSLAPQFLLARLMLTASGDLASTHPEPDAAE